MEEKELPLPQRKEYIKNIKDLEVSCYQQKLFMKRIKSKIESLEEEVSAASPFPSMISEIVAVIFFVGIAALIGGVIGIFFSAVPKGIMIGSGIATALGLIILISAVSDRKKYKKEIENEKMEIEGLTEVLSDNENKLEETAEVLKQYYDKNVVYPKYREMVAICSICEYLESGRCFTLEGPDGAYNLYETEVRADLIIRKLDDVIRHLDRLSAGQQMLANIIRDSNDKIDRLTQSIDNIGGSLDNIKKSTALNTYYNKIALDNAAYYEWITAWTSRVR